MKVIVEFQLKPEDPAQIIASASAKFLGVYPTPKGPIIIAEIDTNCEEQVVVDFYTRMSGSNLPDGVSLEYVGSFHAVRKDHKANEPDPILFHVYRNPNLRPFITKAKEV